MVRDENSDSGDLSNSLGLCTSEQYDLLYSPITTLRTSATIPSACTFMEVLDAYCRGSDRLEPLQESALAATGFFRSLAADMVVVDEHARIDGNVVGSSELTMKHIQRCCISNSIRARCLQSKILVARYRAGRQFEQSAQRLLSRLSESSIHKDLWHACSSSAVSAATANTCNCTAHSV